MKRSTISIFAFLSLVSGSSILYERIGERKAMVERQIKKRGIMDSDVLAAMQRVPRHLFVPESERPSAYGDYPIPIGYGQTISQPYIVSYMTEKLNIDSSKKVLEIGTGSGYQAAVLAEITPHVYTVEVIPELARSAKKLLVKLGYENIKLLEADGYYGWKSEAPFDAIIVTAAPEHVPPPLINQLKEGGNMIIPVGSQFSTQFLVQISKDKNGKIRSKNLLPVRFVPLVKSSQSLETD